MTSSVQQDDHISYDAARAERFEKKIVDILNAGALTLMLSVGHPGDRCVLLEGHCAARCRADQ